MEFKVVSSVEKILKECENRPESFDRIFVFGVFEGHENDFLKNKSLNKFYFLYKRLKQLDFKAKKGKNVLVESPITSLVHGLDKKTKFNYDSIRCFVSNSLKIARKNKIKDVTFIFPDMPNEYYLDDGLFFMSSAVAEGASLGLYEFKKYKTKDADKGGKKAEDFRPIRVYFGPIAMNKAKEKQVKEGLDFGKITSEAANFARDMINEPGNVATPIYLANIAKEFSTEVGIECKIFDEKDIVKHKMLSFYGVARGSKNPPRFIHLIYKPKPTAKKNKIKKIAIVGKGVTFDSGGLSLKPSDFMTNMKSDKSGACAVLGIMRYVSKLNLGAEVHGIIAACENMPDGHAQRPDDIVKALNGKTIEIENTDAEGRLTLADALTFAENIGVDEIIDIATLTGACVVALGEYTSGVMGNDKTLINSIIKTSEISGEKMWELPFDDNMREKLSSPIADIRNIGNRYGGAITAGMFLEEFVSDKVKWCHIDIAGPSFTKTGFTYNPKGATGVGARTILYYLRQQSC